LIKKISWGILSTSKFAARATIPATQRSKYSEVSAIASRDLERAKDAADKLGIPKVYGSYEDLLGDPSIDVVYNPLPNHLHVDWTLKSLEAGKHVLCEKPIALSYNDAMRLAAGVKEYPRLKVMEAFMYRHHPQWRKVKELIDQNAIGEIKRVHSVFAYFNDDPSNIRNKADFGGGAMLDIGCYSTSLSRFIFEREPIRVLGKVEYDLRTGTDKFAAGMFDFGDGIATFSCATQMQRYQKVDIHGTLGRIEIEIPFNPPIDRPTRIYLHRGESVEELSFEACDQYTIQSDLFAEAILNDGEVPTPLDDAFANMKVIDAVGESSRLGRLISI
jgi:predicted dehydrogenase